MRATARGLPNNIYNMDVHPNNQGATTMPWEVKRANNSTDGAEKFMGLENTECAATATYARKNAP